MDDEGCGSLTPPPSPLSASGRGLGEGLSFFPSSPSSVSPRGEVFVMLDLTIRKLRHLLGRLSRQWRRRTLQAVASKRSNLGIERLEGREVPSHSGLAAALALVPHHATVLPSPVAHHGGVLVPPHLHVHPVPA